jgi:hypothetical protein
MMRRRWLNWGPLGLDNFYSFYVTTSQARACMVAKERFFPFTQKFHFMCHSPTES